MKQACLCLALAAAFLPAFPEATQTDPNATLSDANATLSDANATLSDANATLSDAKETLSDPVAAPVVATTLFADGTTNAWTQADLVGALGLVNRKYHRDMATAAGRAQWHGRRVAQYLVPSPGGPSRLVEVYADGYAHTNAPTRAASRQDPEAAEKKRLADLEWAKRNLPPEVAALLEKRGEAAK